MQIAKLSKYSEMIIRWISKGCPHVFRTGLLLSSFQSYTKELNIKLPFGKRSIRGNGDFVLVDINANTFQVVQFSFYFDLAGHKQFL